MTSLPEVCRRILRLAGTLTTSVPALLALAAVAAPLSAQHPPAGRQAAADTTPGAAVDTIREPDYRLDPLVVTGTRTHQPLALVVHEVSIVGREEIQLAARQLTPADPLQGIPGLFAQNRQNFSMSGGVRLSIRSPGPQFGMRGLQLVEDGIPLTTADGTTQAGNLDFASAGQVEVIRGPSSVLYGNSAGGVINVRSEFPPDRTFVAQPQVQLGSYGFRQQQVKVEGRRGPVGYVADLGRLETDGFRQHSHARIRRMNVVARADVSHETELDAVFNLYDMPFGQSPSTLTLEDAMSRPRSARALASEQGWGESSSQGQGGIRLRRSFGDQSRLDAIVWGLKRNVWNPIPFRVVNLGRTGGGLRSQYDGEARVGSHPVDWIVGLDVSDQRDDRTEFSNEGVSATSGTAVQGALLVDQLEQVSSLGPFAQVSVAVAPLWRLIAGVRYDRYDFSVHDHLLTDGDQSGSRLMHAASPTVGVTFTPGSWLSLYGNFATAYQTPTTVELSNRPSGEGGFNQDLSPEYLRSFEVGARGLAEPWRLHYEVAVYVSKLDDALVQYQRPDEQSFFRNAGRSSRDGIELLLEWMPVEALRARVAYTYQDFRFDRYTSGGTDYGGNVEPGAPSNRVYAALATRTRWGLRSQVAVRWVGSYPVNDANTVYNPSYEVVDLRLGFDRSWMHTEVSPFLGVDNLFNERYNASTVPNAVGQRYFEPAPDREIYGGLSVGLGAR